MAVNRDDVKGEIHITDKGVTIRTLLGFAAKGYDLTNRRSWKIVYNGVPIGSLQVKNTTGGKANDNSNATRIRKCKTAEATTGISSKDVEGAGVDVVTRPPEENVIGNQQVVGGNSPNDINGIGISRNGAGGKAARPEDRPGAQGVQRRAKDARRVRTVAGNQPQAICAENTTGANPGNACGDGAPCGTAATTAETTGNNPGATGNGTGNPGLPAELDHG